MSCDRNDRKTSIYDERFQLNTNLIQCGALGVTSTKNLNRIYIDLIFVFYSEIDNFNIENIAISALVICSSELCSKVVEKSPICNGANLFT